MKLTELVLEDESKTFLTELKKAKNNLKLMIEGNILYRGVDYLRDHATELGTLENGSTVFASKGRSTPRRSQTNTNFFLNLASENERWKDIPSRQFSTFTAAHPSEAGDFGSLVAVVPYDSVNSFAAMKGDFNLKRVAFFGDARLSISGLFSYISHVVGPDTSDWKRYFNKILSFETLEEFLQYEPDSGQPLKYRLRDYVKSDEDLKNLQADITNSNVLKTMKKYQNYYGARLSDAFDAGQVNAAGYLMDAFKLDIDSKNESLLALYEALDNSNMLMFNATRLRRDYGNFGDSFYDSIVDAITPERFGIKTFDSYDKALDHAESTGEIWFTGPYLVLTSSSSHSFRSESDAKEYIKDPAFKDLIDKL